MNFEELGRLLLQSGSFEGVLQQVVLGVNWTVVETDSGIGIAYSPVNIPRTLGWSGTLVGRSTADIAGWLMGINPVEVAIGLATINAWFNGDGGLLSQAHVLDGDGPAHLRVFSYFKDYLLGKKVVVIGHYPGLKSLWCDLPYVCIERRPQVPEDIPEAAASQILFEADWVFVTASSIVNQSLPDLLGKLSSTAQTVLMGPSMPWWLHWQALGFSWLAGVRIRSRDALWQTVLEGGGTRIFETGVDYCLLNLNTRNGGP